MALLGFLYAAQNQDKTKTVYRYPPGTEVSNVMFVLAGCNILGLLFTFPVSESKGKPLEGMSADNKEDEMRNETVDPSNIISSV